MAVPRIEPYLDTLISARTPGLQYLALNSAGPLFQYNVGLADIRHQRPMDAATTLNAYSMSKTITAAAVLKLVQAQAVGLEEPVARYLPSMPYGPAITIRQLLSHTSGIPNPIPLRWVHPIAQHDAFDEAAALRDVTQNHPRLSSSPGSKYAYSNIGYWLLGDVVAKAAGEAFTSYVTERIFKPLSIPPSDLAYNVRDFARHAQGYLEKYSLTNLAKRFLIDRELIGSYEGRWLRIEPHYVNGPAFGGLIGTTNGFGLFLQDQLRPESALFSEKTRNLFYTRQQTITGTSIPMTLGWHAGLSESGAFYYKEGGGGGFHCMMRVYRDAGVATIVMANATGFDVRKCLDVTDSHFL
jgi:D-alanyl-D-alanine carboxypeptidase